MKAKVEKTVIITMTEVEAEDLKQVAQEICNSHDLPALKKIVNTLKSLDLRVW